MLINSKNSQPLFIKCVQKKKVTKQEWRPNGKIEFLKPLDFIGKQNDISTNNEMSMRFDMREITRVFKALSDSNRLRILKMLEVKPLCVCEITEVLRLATSTVSKHLSILREADLISDSKEGKWVIYQLNPSTGNEQVNQLLPLIKKWLPEDEIVKQDLEKVKFVDRNIICGT
jgi:ArsR family transcriptional regulator